MVEAVVEVVGGVVVEMAVVGSVEGMEVVVTVEVVVAEVAVLVVVAAAEVAVMGEGVERLIGQALLQLVHISLILLFYLS
jgi:hypothetical protein